MKKSWVLIACCLSALAFLQACAKQPDAEESCNFVQNADMQRVSWGDNSPVVLYIDSSVPSAYYSTIQAAVDKWNNSRGRTLLKIGGISNRGGAPAQDGANIIYWLNTWEANKSNEQARTTIFWAGAQIYEADVRINHKDFEYFAGEKPESGKVDLQSLLVHEFGHVLGLTHADLTESVMVKTLPSGITSRRDPRKFDIDSIRCEY